MGLTLRFHNEDLSICALPYEATAPAEILGKPFSCFMRTGDEATLICPTSLVPTDTLKSESGWNAVEFVGPFAFDEVGILTQVANPLAAAGISIIALATFNTDYILIKVGKRAEAVAALQKAGHKIL